MIILMGLESVSAFKNVIGDLKACCVVWQEGSEAEGDEESNDEKDKEEEDKVLGRGQRNAILASRTRVSYNSLERFILLLRLTFLLMFLFDSIDSSALAKKT